LRIDNRAASASAEGRGPRDAAMLRIVGMIAWPSSRVEPASQDHWIGK